MSLTLTKREACDRLGIGLRQLERHAADGMPKQGDGKEARYPWPEIRVWRDKYLVESGKQSVQPGPIEESESRLAAANAAQAELKLARLREQLMTVEDYRRVRYDGDQRVAARLKTLPTRAAPLLVGCQTEAEVLTRLEPVVREVMDELHRAEDVPQVDEDAA